MTTVRERVKDIQVEMRDTTLGLDRAAVLLQTLAALVGHCNEAVRLADAAYTGVTLQYLESGERVHLSRLRAQLTPEYQQQREARDTRELVKALMQSLKLRLRTAEAERFRT